MYQKNFHNGTVEISVDALRGIQCSSQITSMKRGASWPFRSNGAAWVGLFCVLEAGCGIRRQLPRVLNRSHCDGCTSWPPLFGWGFMFFFVLAVAPTLKALDPATRAKVFPEIASRGLWWLRWSALVGWLAGFRYFMILAKTDAVNAGRPHAWGAWIGIWLACWLAAFAIEMALLRAGGPLGNPIRRGHARVCLSWRRFPGWSFRFWRNPEWATARSAFRSAAGWERSFPERVGDCLALSEAIDCVDSRGVANKERRCRPKRPNLARMATLTMQINFWLSFPMIFFMAASAHFPFLSAGRLVLINVLVIFGGVNGKASSAVQDSAHEDARLPGREKFVADAAPADLPAEQRHQRVPQRQERRHRRKKSPDPAVGQQLRLPVRKNFHDRGQAQHAAPHREHRRGDRQQQKVNGGRARNQIAEK